MTLKDHNALCHANRASFGAHQENLKEDKCIVAYYQRQKCRPCTLLSGGIRWMWIFIGVSWQYGRWKSNACQSAVQNAADLKEK